MYATFGPYIAEIQARDGNPNTGPVTIAQLQQKYTEYNSKYFQNKLPQVQIRFANLPGETAGLTSYQAYDRGNQQIIDPKSIVISMNNMFRSPNVHYGQAGSSDSILLHEMSHVLMGILGHVNEKHGQKFQSWLHRLAPASGYSYDDLMGKQQAAEHLDIQRLKDLSGIRD